MHLARLPQTCGTTLPLVSHVGSKVSVSCPRIGLQAVELPALCCGPIRIDELAQIVAMMRDMVGSRRVFGLHQVLGWNACHTILSELSNYPNKDYGVQ